MVPLPRFHGGGRAYPLSRRHAREVACSTRSNSDLVMPGLVPGIPITVAMPCHNNRDRRNKSGDDEVGTNENKGSGTPAGAVFHDAVPAGTAARHGQVGLRQPVRCRARSPAGVPPRFSPEGLSSQKLSSGQASRHTAPTGRGSLRRRRARFQRSTSHAGLSAGRHDAWAAREQS
jgi:hypothetical protein